AALQEPALQRRELLPAVAAIHLRDVRERDRWGQDRVHEKENHRDSETQRTITAEIAEYAEAAARHRCVARRRFAAARTRRAVKNASPFVWVWLVLFAARRVRVIGRRSRPTCDAALLRVSVTLWLFVITRPPQTNHEGGRTPSSTPGTARPSRRRAGAATASDRSDRRKRGSPGTRSRGV